MPKVTRNQLNSVRRMLNDREARISRCGTYIEIRCTSNLAHIDAFLNQIEALENQLGITLATVDSQIYAL